MECFSSWLGGVAVVTSWPLTSWPWHQSQQAYSSLLLPSQISFFWFLVFPFQGPLNSESSNQSLCSVGSLSDKEVEVRAISIERLFIFPHFESRLNDRIIPGGPLGSMQCELCALSVCTAVRWLWWVLLLSSCLGCLFFFSFKKCLLSCHQ